jgi:hypothetical protein
MAEVVEDSGNLRTIRKFEGMQKEHGDLDYG